jgi:hypothetical protein
VLLLCYRCIAIDSNQATLLELSMDFWLEFDQWAHIDAPSFNGQRIHCFALRFLGGGITQAEEFGGDCKSSNY